LVKTAKRLLNPAHCFDKTTPLLIIIKKAKIIQRSFSAIYPVPEGDTIQGSFFFTLPELIESFAGLGFKIK
jgi:hypothetical protein